VSTDVVRRWEPRGRWEPVGSVGAVGSGSELRLGAVLGAGAAAMSAGGEARPSDHPESPQSMGQANLLQATMSMSDSLAAPPLEAWVRTEW
jgi:hypothetical protein